MKKFAAAVIIVGAFIVYSLLYRYANSVPVLPTTSSATSSSTRSSAAAASSAPNTSSSTDAPNSTPGPSNSSYKDGTYTGSVADAQWGYVQVKVVIQNSKITAVPFLQYPNDRRRSIQINQYADPLLTSEAIQAQSANVDIVSGATDSSEAFIQSLSDALAKAKA